MPPRLLSLNLRPWTLLSWCLALCSVLVLLSSLDGRQSANRDRLLHLRCEAAVSQSLEATQQRVRQYGNLLGNLALHFNYLGPQSHKRFSDAVRSRQLSAGYPAITRIGYFVPASLQPLRGYEFRPDGRHAGAASPARRLPAAQLLRPLDYSRDFNTLGLSAGMPGDLPEAQGAPTAVMLVKPVYDNTTVGISRGSRRHHHRGWIYALVDTSKLLDGVQRSSLGPLQISVYDGLSRQNETTLLFGELQGSEPVADVPGLKSVRPIGLASRAWTQVARLGHDGTVPAAEPAQESRLLWLLAAFMIVLAARYLRVAWQDREVERADKRAF